MKIFLVVLILVILTVTCGTIKLQTNLIQRLERDLKQSHDTLSRQIPVAYRHGYKDGWYMARIRRGK